MHKESMVHQKNHLLHNKKKRKRLKPHAEFDLFCLILLQYPQFFSGTFFRNFPQKQKRV